MTTAYMKRKLLLALIITSFLASCVSRAPSMKKFSGCPSHDPGYFTRVRR